jgi:DNA-binding transcriptional LysR family regulator
VDTLTSIRVFRQVVESGSFVAAADRLDFSTAMVSKHVMNVEKRLGVRLLNRNTRTLSLTEPGRVYFERCKTILDDLEDTELELRSLNAAPRGTLRITAPSWFAGQLFADMLAQYRRRYAEVVVDVSFEDRYVDLVAEGFDLALRVTADSPPGGLIARPVRPLTVLVGASRHYLEQHGTPKSPEDLASHDCVGIGSWDSWVFEGEKGRIVVPARIVVRYRTLVGAANAVSAGIGLAPLPLIYFHDPVFRSGLVPILTEYPLRKPMLYVIYTSRKHAPLKIRTFIDHFIAFVATHAPD